MILRVLQMYNDPNVREQEIKKMAEVYEVLKVDILPKLRRSEIYAKFKTRERTDQEYVNVAKTNPDILSQEELFYAAQQATGADKETIYKQYIQKYPNDWRAYNNLAVYYLQSGKLEDAETNFLKADQLDPNNPSVLNNLGVVYWTKGDFAKAKEYFQKAYNLSANNEAI
jgi:tetratricopeptide (TPR) repeat protein